MKLLMLKLHVFYPSFKEYIYRLWDTILVTAFVILGLGHPLTCQVFEKCVCGARHPASFSITHFLQNKTC